MKTASGHVLIAGILGLILFCIGNEATRPKVLSELGGDSAEGSPDTTRQSNGTVNFYIFNVTNPEEVAEGGIPALQEVGPYTYRQIRRRIILDQNPPSNETITYMYETEYIYDQRLSGRNTESDVVNIFNVPFIQLMNKLINAGLQTTAELISAELLPTEQIVRRSVTVRELLFDGLNISVHDRSLLPPQLSDLKYGIYNKGKNGTMEGIYEVFTGATGLRNEGIIKTWNGEPSLGFWSSERCDDFLGMEATDGSMFPPPMNQASSVSVFNSELCRSLKMVFESEVIVNNQTAWRFVPRQGELDGPEDNPSNQCYCLRENVTECRNGMVDVSVCNPGSPPLLMSKPHFLDGDEEYAERLGLAPNQELHESSIDIDPISGLLVGATKRIQENIEMSVPSGHTSIPQYRNVTSCMVLPVLWTEEIIHGFPTNQTLINI